VVLVSRADQKKKEGHPKTDGLLFSSIVMLWCWRLDRHR
jgi:hypothetical protein